MHFDRKSRASALLIRRTIGNLVRGNILRRDHLLPYFVVYHANLACNAACNFCSRAADIAGARWGEEIDLTEIEIIFRGLRSLVPSLYIAGGEPLLQRNIEEMLQLARELGFWPVAVNTNATMLDQRPDVLRYADSVVVSIHSTDVATAAGIFKISTRLAERMFTNIREGAVEARRYGNQVIGNCVLTGQNTEDAHRVLDFCLEHHIPLAVVPAVENYWPTVARDSHARTAYVHFIERVIAVKRKNTGAIQGTLRFLKRIRDLGSFDCRPSGMLTVDPHGNIVTPCEYKYAGRFKQHLGKLSPIQDAASILASALDYRARFRSCDKRCLKACYVEPSISIEAPIGAALEFLPFGRLRSFGRRD